MIFPIGDQNVEGGYRPYVAYSLLVINVLVWLYQSVLDLPEYEQLIHQFGMIPAEILEGKGWYTLITSMFLHGDFLHLLGNMLFLWIFADNIEAVAGHGRFLMYYLLGGLTAGLIHVAFNLYSPIPTIGASGAISAVLGSYLVFFPRSQVRVIVLFLFSSFYVPAVLFLGIWILMQLYSGVGSLNAAGVMESGVAWWAHIGGFFFGVLYGLRYKRKFVSGFIDPDDASTV